jgi:alpha-L-rhamnosidase
MPGFGRALAVLLAGGLLLMSLTGCASSANSQKVVDLRCEDKPSPLGIDVSKPYLSWRMESPRRGTMQTGYHILVASDPANLEPDKADLWDSGLVDSDQSVNVEYAGTPLGSGETAYWKVLVRDEQGGELASEPARWEMGLLQPSDWSAQWIDYPPSQRMGPPEPNPTTALATTSPATTQSTQPSGHAAERHEYPPNMAPFFRKEFEIQKPVARARLYATALGLYDCWINGKQTGDAVLAPDWTNYHHRVRYQTYDVTDSLRSGHNAIAALLGDGWYSGNVGWIGNRVYGSRPAFLAQLVIEYTDGSRDVVATDGSWRATVGPILHSDLQNGEDYDARLEMPGWNSYGFDDSSWSSASIRQENPALEAQIGPPVRKTHELPARSVTPQAGGKYIFDFGQNMVGFARLRARAPAGTKVTIRFAEMLNPDGTIYIENLRLARQADSYIFKGDGQETWEPRFTIHGFRYAEISGLPGKVDPKNLTGIVISSDTPEAGTWECSNPLLNQLHSNIVWGQRGNYLSVPTDCPQRNERLGWMGDAQVFIRTAAWNYDVREFFENWLVEVADAQTADGAFTDVSPHVAAGQGVAAWADAGIICPWTIYQVYGDERLLARQYPSMVKYIDYLLAHSDKLIRPAKGYGDWLSINADTPKDLLATAYFAHDADLMSRIAWILGKSGDSARYAKLFGEIRAAFNKEFVDKDGRIKGHTQTGYLLALRFDLVDEPVLSHAERDLVDDITDKDDHLSTGFVGVSYLLPTLTRFGELDTAYRLMLQDTFPSWLFPVKMGATTVWERWDGWTPEKGFQTPKMNSFNHYSLGSCGQWMFDTIAGIGQDERTPGFKQIVIHPQPGGGLTWAAASYKSAYGEIKSRWDVKDGKFTLHVTIPPNTTATVYVPSSDGSEIKESGHSVEQAEGVTFVRWVGNSGVFEVGSGEYVFTTAQ